MAGRSWRWALGWAACAAACPASANGPEAIEQLEPAAGEWQIEASLLASHDAPAELSVQLLRGLNDHIAIGVEVEAEWANNGVSLDRIAPTILYRFSDGTKSVGVGIIGQVALASDLTPVGASMRAVVERKARRWWGQANAIVTAERDDSETNATIGYGWRISRLFGEAIWLGAEGSGQVARLSGPPSAGNGLGHYFGPAVTIVPTLKAGELEVNASYLRRVAGQGPRSALQISAQINL